MLKKISLLLVLLLCLSACAEKEPETLIVGALSDVSSAPLFLAANRGLFSSPGIQIQLFYSAAERDAALQSGEIHGAVSDVLGLAFAINGGFDLRVTSRTEGVYRMVAAPGAAQKMAELDGGIVAISPNTIIEYSVDQMLANADIAMEKQIIREMPVRLEMLLAGKVDAACLPEPLASGAVLSGGRIVGDSNELGMELSVMLFRADAIDTKNALIRDFYKGYDLACEALNQQDTAAALTELEQIAGFPQGVGDVLVLPSYRAAAMIGREGFDQCILWMVERDLISQTIAFDDAISGEFVP